MVPGAGSNGCSQQQRGREIHDAGRSASRWRTEWWVPLAWYLSARRRHNCNCNERVLRRMTHEPVPSGGCRAERAVWLWRYAAKPPPPSPSPQKSEGELLPRYRHLFFGKKPECWQGKKD